MRQSVDAVAVLSLQISPPPFLNLFLPTRPFLAFRPMWYISLKHPEAPIECCKMSRSTYENEHHAQDRLSFFLRAARELRARIRSPHLRLNKFSLLPTAL